METTRITRQKQLIVEAQKKAEEIKNNLKTLKTVDIEKCYFITTFDGINQIHIPLDILLAILRYLEIQDLIILMRVSKLFYSLCHSNPVWGRFLFMNNEKLKVFIYNATKDVFPDMFHFNMYAELDNHFWIRKNFAGKHYISLTYDLFDLFSYLRPPYFFKEIRKIVQEKYTNRQIDYIVKSTRKFTKNDLSNPDIKFQIKYSNDVCDTTVNFTEEEIEEENNEVKKIIIISKIILPHLVHPNVIRQKFVRFYPENVRNLFLDNFTHIDKC